MADFYAAVTTDAGIALVADLLTGEQLVFTKLVTGSGVYTDEDITRVRLQRAGELRQPRQEFGFSSMEKVTDFCVRLKALMSNARLTEGYRITEIGVYAKKPGDEGDGILYSISVAKEADFFPHYNGIAAVEIIEEYYITVSDAAEVTIKGRNGAAVLLEDFEEFKKEIWEQIADISQKMVVPFVQMTESTYVPLELRTKGSLYGLITNKRGLITEHFDRYICGMEEPSKERTLYGIETMERTEAEEDKSPYVGIFSNIVHIEDGYEIERQFGMIYAVNRETR